jgi:hypothetical protein
MTFIWLRRGRILVWSVDIIVRRTRAPPRSHPSESEDLIVQKGRIFVIRLNAERAISPTVYFDAGRSRFKWGDDSNFSPSWSDESDRSLGIAERKPKLQMDLFNRINIFIESPGDPLKFQNLRYWGALPGFQRISGFCINISKLDGEIMIRSLCHALSCDTNLALQSKPSCIQPKSGIGTRGHFIDNAKNVQQDDQSSMIWWWTFVL